MAESGMMSPADVLALANNSGLNGGELIMFMLFAMIFGWNGGGFGGNGNGSAIQADVNRGFDNQNLQAQTRDILAAVTGGTAQSIAATTQTFHDTMGVVQNAYGELQRDIAGLAVGQAGILAKQNECCASTQLQYAQGNAALAAQIAQNEYNNAMRDAATNAHFTAEIQGVKDMLYQKEIASLQQKVAFLENGMQTKQLQADIAAATAGVVRYPNGWTYNAGPAPFCNFGCNNM